MSEQTYSLELIYKCFCSNSASSQDKAVCFIHWTLLSNGFRCLQGDTKSELLPDDWNANQALYQLNYQLGENKYLVKIVPSVGTLLVNLAKLNTDQATSSGVRIDELVNENSTSFLEIYKNTTETKNVLAKELISPHLTPSRDATTSRDEVRETAERRRQQQAPPDDPLLIPGPQRSGYFTPYPNPMAVGGADLDPLGRGIGGGMLMDMRRGGPNVNVPGGVPPGARFDPFGPPGVGPQPGRPGSNRTRVFGEPNPDHLPPPGYDDMFM